MGVDLLLLLLHGSLVMKSNSGCQLWGRGSKQGPSSQRPGRFNSKSQKLQSLISAYHGGLVSAGIPSIAVSNCTHHTSRHRPTAPRLIENRAGRKGPGS